MTGGRGTITFDGLSQFRKAVPAAPAGLPASFGTPPPIQYCNVVVPGQPFPFLERPRIPDLDQGTTDPP